MCLNRIVLALMAIVLLVNGKSVQSPVSHQTHKSAKEVTATKVTKLDLNTSYANALRFISEFRKLKQKLSENEIRIVSTVGLVSGALQVEDALRENLYNIADQLFDTFAKATPKENVDKLLEIEETINRDKASIAVLNEMLKFARNETDLVGFEKEMQRVSRQNEASGKRLRKKKLAVAKETKESKNDDSVDRKTESTGKLMHRTAKSLKHEISKKLYDVREMIDKHIDDIHSSVTDSAKETIKFVQKVQKSDEKLMKRQSESKLKSVKLDPSLSALKRLWDQVASAEPDSSEFAISLKYHPNAQLKKDEKKKQKPRLTLGEQSSEESIKRSGNSIDPKLDRFRRQNKRKEPITMVEIEFGDEKEKQEDEENEIDAERSKQESGEEFDESSASSSEEPGGLVGLISNLSGGDEGSDVGAVFGALSQVLTNILGPGGLDIPSVIGSGTALLSSLLAGEENFGKVLGNYVGTAIDGFSGGGGAANNGQFFGQFIGKFISSLSADPDDDDAPLQPASFLQNLLDGIGRGSGQKTEVAKDGEEKPGGSDSASFITHVITTIVAGVTSGIANASLGSSGGSSQGSTGLLGGSSQGSSAQSQHKT